MTDPATSPGSHPAMTTDRYPLLVPPDSIEALTASYRALVQARQAVDPKWTPPADPDGATEPVLRVQLAQRCSDLGKWLADHHIRGRNAALVADASRIEDLGPTGYMRLVGETTLGSATIRNITIDTRRGLRETL